MTVRGQPEQEATVSIRTHIDLEGCGALETQNVYAGPKAIGEAMRDVVNPVGYIVHNPFEKPKFKRIEIEATIGKGSVRAAIADVLLSKRSFRAGEQVEAMVTMMPVRSERKKIKVMMDLPKDLKPGMYQLAICDADTDMQIDSGERAYQYEARSLAEVVEILGRPSPRERIVMRLSAVRPGVAVGDRAFAEVPGSVLSGLGGQMRSDVNAFAEPIRVEQEVPYVVVGMQRTQIVVLPAEDEAGTSEEREE